MQSDKASLNTILRQFENPEFSRAMKRVLSGLSKTAAKQMIADFESLYARYLKDTFIHISDRNPVPGYRQVIFTGHALSDQKKSNTGVIAVTDDGRLVTGSIVKSTGFENLITIREALKSMRGDQGVRRFSRHYPELEQNAATKELKFFIQSFPFRNYSEHEFSQIVEQQVARGFNRIHDVLCKTLDLNVVKTLSDIGFNTLNMEWFHYCSWLTGGDGVAHRIIQARQQAVKAYPLLAQQFYLSKKLTNAIDDRVPLAAAIAAHKGVDEYKIKRLWGLTAKQVALPSYLVKNNYHVDRRIEEILAMPDHMSPETPEQFRQLGVFRQFGRIFYSNNFKTAITAMSKNGNPWRLIDQMEKIGKDNVFDAVDFLITKLVIPATLNKISKIADTRKITPSRRITEHYGIIYKAMYDKSFSKIISDFSFRNLLDLSDRYHRNIERYEDRLDMISLDYDWPGMIGEMNMKDGCIARELTSSRQFREHGRKQNNCVGGYISRILEDFNIDKKRAELIFSIEKNNKCLSTVQIGYDAEKSGPPRIWIIQNKGYGNTSASADAKKITARFLARLKKIDRSVFSLYLNGLHQVCQGFKNDLNQDLHIRRCRFNPLDRNHMERVWAELAPTLPRKLRKPGLDAFIDQIPVTEKMLSICLYLEEVDKQSLNELKKIFNDEEKLSDAQPMAWTHLH